MVAQTYEIQFLLCRLNRGVYLKNFAGSYKIKKQEHAILLLKKSEMPVIAC